MSKINLISWYLIFKIVEVDQKEKVELTQMEENV